MHAFTLAAPPAPAGLTLGASPAAQTGEVSAAAGAGIYFEERRGLLTSLWLLLQAQVGAAAGIAAAAALVPAPPQPLVGPVCCCQKPEPPRCSQTLSLLHAA